MVVADAGYETPAIAHQLLEDGIQLLFPYTRAEITSKIIEIPGRNTGDHFYFAIIDKSLSTSNRQIIDK